jgi:protein gp37
MGDRSSIEWTDATWTPIRARNTKTGKVGTHCEKVSPGCVNCYAERRNRWVGTGRHYTRGDRDAVEPRTFGYGELPTRSRL